MEGGFLEDGARCYGVSTEIQRIMSLKKVLLSCGKQWAVCSIIDWCFWPESFTQFYLWHDVGSILH